MLTSISGKSVIVTGGSKGIGKGIAMVFASKGAKVMIAARTEKGADGPVKSKVVDDLGLTLSAITGSAIQEFKLGDDAKGVLVTDVNGTGPAAEKGVRPGDLIVEVGQEEVASPEDVVRKVKEARDAGRKSVLLLVQGQNGLRFVAIRLGTG